MPGTAIEKITKTEIKRNPYEPEVTSKNVLSKVK